MPRTTFHNFKHLHIKIYVQGVMKIFPWLLACLYAVLLLAGCSSAQKLKDGEMAFRQKSYALAANLFKTEFEKEDDPKIKGRKAYMAAESYRLSNQTQQAEKWYAEALRLEYPDPQLKLHYGLVLMANEKYNQAITVFSEYARDDPFNKQKANELIRACREAAKWITAKHNMTITSLGINTPANEFAPVFYRNKDLLFTSDRYDASGSDIYGWTGEKYTDIFIAKREPNGEYRTLAPFDAKINSGFHDGTPAINADFTILYFTRCGSQGKKDDYCRIYETVFDGVYWSDPIPVPFFGDTVNTGTPWLSPGADTMIFAADVPAAGYGGKDLYISYYQDGQWTAPLNLGGEINTAGNELFPYVDSEGTLYFSSDGHPGMGGLDIFQARREGGIWKNPVNVKTPLNSGADDFGIIFEKIKPRDDNDPVRMSGYFSSPRPGGSGGDDIYHFILANENIFKLEGIVLEKIYENPLDPNSKVIDFEPLPGVAVTLKKYEGGLKVIDSLNADKFGKFEFELEPRSRYKVVGEKPGYFTQSEDVSTIGLRDMENILITIKVRLLMQRIYEEKEIVLPNIYYDYDKTTLREESKTVLDTLAKLLMENPDIIVELGSHTDSRGSDQYNMVLSQGRAESVVRYLIEKGIDPRRLRARGYGETRLINHCANGVECTEEEHQLNRRTTFKVLSEKLVIESVTPDSIPVDPRRK
ncbi:MAG: cell envelope biogenesis protein OmpA [Chitinophagales bacterium]|nr:MAG: cell envelope biogenesis protein OmpA [Chitinophagales bacterium]